MNYIGCSVTLWHIPQFSSMFGICDVLLGSPLLFPTLLSILSSPGHVSLQTAPVTPSASWDALYILVGALLGPIHGKGSLLTCTYPPGSIYSSVSQAAKFLVSFETSLR